MYVTNKGRIVATLFVVLIVGINFIPMTSAERDYWPTDGWRVSTPREQGMNTTKLDDLVDFLDDSALYPLSLIIVRNGYIVFEKYLSLAVDVNETMDIYSCTLSIISALVGIAIDEGLIESVDAHALDFFPDMVVSTDAARKGTITIEHLLTMTSGLSWEENNDPVNMKNTDDWVQYVFDKPMIFDAGTSYEYNSGNAHILSAILQNVTGMTTSEMADEYLFGPMGIADYEWDEDPQGITDGTGACELSTRDMAKFGYLYLNNGTWDTEQIVPAEWVATSQQSLATVNSIKDYGYLWWIYRGVGAYNAVGFWARVISVIPEYDIVAVVTGYDSYGNFLRDQWTEAITDYIIPAAQYSGEQAPTFDIFPILIGAGIVCVVLVIAVFIRRK